ncbi:enoyl-CoA hydratase/isomerase [Histoplasma ohiense]|nr:enoyl-CoA hydratase/isomerase [Histoplasma ohiense (nom. inval.)]
MTSPLFTIQTAEGVLTCTQPQDAVYLLTFNFAPDNRLTEDFCQAMLLSLDIIQFKYPPGVVITTSAIPKFYSNGLDLQKAVTTKGFFENNLFALFKRLLTYPLPTVALINGHAFAGGFMTAMYHDYRIFNSSRGFLCLNEVHFGAALKPAMCSIFREKIANPAIFRTIVQEGYRFSGREALEYSIVDALGGVDVALALIEKKKLTKLPISGVFGQLRREMYRETYELLERCGDDTAEEEKEAEKELKVNESGLKRVEEWQRRGGKAAKL